MREFITVPDGVTFESLNPVITEGNITFSEPVMNRIFDASSFIEKDRELLEMVICFTFYLHWKIETNNRIESFEQTLRENPILIDRIQLPIPTVKGHC